MNGLSSVPRGERPGRPGTAWERVLLRGAEVVVPELDGADSPFAWDEAPLPDEARPNRAARRAARRLRRRRNAPSPRTPERRLTVLQLSARG